MVSVSLQPVSVEKAIALKNELLLAGFIMHEDFEWRYYQAKWDEHSLAGVEPSTVVFEFAQESWATFYRLKWSNV